ncbi:MAG: heme-binding domain-containing protein [Flavobacteriaceae bacterium]|nr:heme-binding domain-containing protein [Flavobacteriaceae bacterium]
MRTFQKIIVVLLVIFIVAQFFQPVKNKGEMSSVEPFLAETNPPNDVQFILEQHCFDCHSNNTIYPWYGSITPVNFWLDDHVEEGKEHFNVSVWEEYSLKKKDHKLEELIEMVESREMPLESYTYAHWDARLSEEEINSVVSWAKQVRNNLGPQ